MVKEGSAPSAAVGGDGGSEQVIVFGWTTEKIR